MHPEAGDADERSVLSREKQITLTNISQLYAKR